MADEKRTTSVGKSILGIAQMIALARKEKKWKDKGRKPSPRALRQWSRADGDRGMDWQTEDIVISAAQKASERTAEPAQAMHLMCEILAWELIWALLPSRGVTRKYLNHRDKMRIPGFINNALGRPWRRPPNCPRIIGTMDGTRLDYVVRGVQAAIYSRNSTRNFEWLKEEFMLQNPDFHVKLGRAVKEKFIRDLFPPGTSTRTIIRRVREVRSKKWG